MAALLAAATPALAGIPDVSNQFTNAGTGAWTDPGNWSYGAVPTFADITLVPQGTANIIAGDAAEVASVIMSGTAALNMSGGTLTSTGDIRAGNGAGHNASFTQSGGDLSITTRGGLWAANGGTGTVTLSGGTTTIGTALGTDYGNVIVGNGAGAVGTLNLEGGTLTSYALAIVARNGGTGNVTMTAGAWNVAGDFGHGTATGKATINQSGGIINIGTEISHPRSTATLLGSFTLGTGNNATTTRSTYTMSGSAQLNVNAHMYIGGTSGSNRASSSNVSGFADLVMNGGTISLGNANNVTGVLYIGNSTATANAAGTVTLNAASATISAPSGVVIGQRQSTGAGAGTGTLTINDGQVLTPRASVTIGRVSGTQGANGTLNLAGGRLQANSIIWQQPSSGTPTQAFNWTGGRLEINSAIADYLITNDGGTLAPGATVPGAFTITGASGSYTQTAAGSLAIDLASDARYDGINATGGTEGAINLAGTVNATLGSGYAPEYGATFAILAAKTISDTATWNLPALPAGLAWDHRVISEGGTQIKSVSVAPASSTPLSAGSWTGPGAVGAAYALGGSGGSLSVDANATAGYLEVGGTGNWSIDGGSTLTFSAASGTAGLTAFGNATAINAPLHFAGDGVIATATGGTTVTVNGTVAGSGTLAKTGPGTLELKNTGSTFSGTWAISGGALNIDDDTNLGAAGASLRVNSAAVNVTNAWTSARAVELQGTGMTVNVGADSALSGAISGVGGLAKNGPNSVTLSGANTYTGATTINAGTLATGAPNAIPSASPVVLQGATSPVATLKLNGHSQNLASLASVGGAGLIASVVTDGADLTVGSANTTTQFRGTIDGGGNGVFTKTGTGIFEITGVPAPIGSLFPDRSINMASIHVQGGILQYDNLIRNRLALPTGDVTVDAGASLSLGGGSGGGYVTNLITGAGGLQFHGGTVEIGNDNDYTGDTELRFGSTVLLDTMGALGGANSPVIAKGVTTAFSNANALKFTLDGTFSKPIVAESPASMTINADIYTLTLDKPVSGDGNITFGGGTVIMAANNVNTGSTYVHPAAATVKLGVDNAFASNQFTLVNGTLDLNGFNQTVASLIGLNTGKIILSAGKTLTTGTDNRDSNGISASYTGGYAGVLTGDGGLTKVGGGLALMTPKYDASLLPFTGPTHVQGGALRWDADSRTLNATNSITVDADALMIFNFTTAGSGGVTPVIDVPIGGGGAVQKNGADPLELTAANTYSGGTRIRGGTLVVSSDANLGAAPASLDSDNIIFSGGGALQLKTAFDVSANRGVFLAGNGAVDTNGFDSTVAAPIAGSGVFTKSGLGRLRVSSIRSGGLSVNAGSVALAANGGASGTSKVATLSIAAGATLDLADNKLITSSPLGAWDGSAYTDVSGLVDSGRGIDSDAQWDGSGIVTSDVRAIGTGNRTSIGVIDASDKFRLAGGAPIGEADTALFAGQTVTGADTLVMFTWGGDANLDGKINIDDYGRIDSNVGIPGANGWANGDFNYDGKLNIDDYGIIDSNISQQGGVVFSTGSDLADLTALPAADGLSAVPEPTTLSLLALGATALLRRCRRGS